jgi:hypothetical protein
LLPELERSLEDLSIVQGLMQNAAWYQFFPTQVTRDDFGKIILNTDVPQDQLRMVCLLYCHVAGGTAKGCQYNCQYAIAAVLLAECFVRPKGRNCQNFLLWYQ